MRETRLDCAWGADRKPFSRFPQQKNANAPAYEEPRIATTNDREQNNTCTLSETQHRRRQKQRPEQLRRLGWKDSPSGAHIATRGAIAGVTATTESAASGVPPPPALHEVHAGQALLQPSLRQFTQFFHTGTRRQQRLATSRGPMRIIRRGRVRHRPRTATIQMRRPVREQLNLRQFQANFDTRWNGKPKCWVPRYVS